MSSIKQALLLQQNGEEVLRKGPWMPEEDEILVEYVWQFGARDWSSIRCKGLLPWTGKSCRLQWVNKLKPDLKRFFFFTFHSDLWPTVQRKELLATTPKFATPMGCTALKNLHWKKTIVQFGDLPAPGYFKKVSLDASAITCCNIPRVGEICCMVICSIHLNAFGPSLIFMKGETLLSMPSTQWTEGETWGPGWNALPASSASPYPPILPNVLCVIEFSSLSFLGSCRSGCKFSSEEERLVVEMQAKLGNKWAKIASCLPGCTDNDVKNFWSTRQKHILCALQQPKMMMMMASAGSTDVSADTSDLSKGRSLPELSTFQVSLKGKLLPYLFKWFAKNII